MSSLDKAVTTQLQNIEKKSGKTLDELTRMVQNSGLTKHSELRQMIIDTLGLGHGDANALVHYALQSDGTRAAEARGLEGSALLDELYNGAKAPLRPVHEQIMATLSTFGDFETVPKKGYLSLRRKKQFAMLGPGSKGRLEVGINAKGLPAAGRLLEQPAGGMCNYKVFLTDPAQVDGELLGWLRQAYDSAG